jgi:hypothetical protein
LVHRICSLIHEGWNVRLHHVYREANRVPDAFALMRCRLVDVTLFDDPSDGIDQLCSFDYPGVTTPRIIFM